MRALPNHPNLLELTRDMYTIVSCLCDDTEEAKLDP